MRKLIAFILMAAAGSLATASIARAGILLEINGDAEISDTSILFGQYPNGAPYAAAPNYGVAQVATVNPGIFSDNGVSPGELGQVQSVDDTNDPVTVSPTPGTSLPSLSFPSGGSNLTFYATSYPRGNEDFLTITDGADGALASFSEGGFVYNSNDQSETPVTAEFSMPFNGMTAAMVVSTLNSGESIRTPFTATFSLGVLPEPATASLLGAALCLGMRRRRR